MNSPLYFLHIPKTAGVSFRTLLESRYAPSQVCPVYSPRDLFTATPGSLDGYRLYRAHLGFTLPAHLRHPVQIVTLLRDPVALVVSMYHFFRRWTPHPLHKLINEQRLALDDFVRHPDCIPYLWNSQTYHLAYQDQVWMPRAVGLALGNQADRLRQRHEAADAFAAQPSSRLIARACERLDQMTFVGLADRLSESVELLCATLDWEPFAEVPRLNVSTDAAAPDRLASSVREHIERLTRLDVEVYSHACALFSQRRANEGVSQPARRSAAYSSTARRVAARRL